MIMHHDGNGIVIWGPGMVDRALDEARLTSLTRCSDARMLGCSDARMLGCSVVLVYF